MGLIVDSGVWIAIERDKRRFADLMSFAAEEPMAIAAITASELLVGVLRADTQERQIRRSVFVEWVLEHIPAVSLDIQVARVHAILWAQLLETGYQIGVVDLLIAATAIATEYTVLTINERDFRRVPGLNFHHLDW